MFVFTRNGECSIFYIALGPIFAFDNWQNICISIKFGINRKLLWRLKRNSDFSRISYKFLNMQEFFIFCFHMVNQVTKMHKSVSFTKFFNKTYLKNIIVITLENFCNTQRHGKFKQSKFSKLRLIFALF